MSTQRLQYIDALRGFAIFGVIVAHAASITAISGAMGRIAGIGGYGVQLFFVISAFTIFLTFDRRALKEQTPVRNFFIRRLVRIIPVYWIGIILYTAVYGMASRGWLPGPELWHIPVHMFLMNLLHPATSSSVVPGGWSISCEIIFYLTVPLWYRLIKTRQNALVFTVCSIAFGSIITILLSQLFASSLTDFPKSMVTQFWYRGFLNQIGCFAFGVLFFFILRDTTGVLKFREKRSNLLLCIAAGTLFVFGFLSQSIFAGTHYVYSASFMLFGIALSQIPWGVIVNPITVFMGKISYSAYLVHFLVLKQATVFIPQGELSANIYFGIILLLSTAITVPLAYLGFLYVETPTISWGKRIIEKLDTLQLQR